jgi:hypothetical protein
MVPLGHVNGIVKMKKGLKKRDETKGKSIGLENSKNPAVSYTRKGCHKVPKGNDGFLFEAIKIGLSPRDGIQIINI